MSSAILSGHVGIVGAGILGIAVARELVGRHPALRITLLEKEPRIASHQTGHNSGVVHAGIYYPTGSLKAQLCVRGMRLLRDYCRARDIPYEECGKLIVAVDAREAARLDELHRRGMANAVEGLRMLDARGLRRVEPHATGVAALHSPRTAITDFAEVARAMSRDLQARGAVLRTGCRVTAIRQRESHVTVEAVGDRSDFDHVLTCTGLQSDETAVLSGDGEDPRIIPFRGDYWQLRPDRRGLVAGLIYPVPDDRFPFLGIHLTKRIDGEVLVGPNAVLAFAREGYRFTTVNLRELWATLRWPGFRRLARRYWRTGSKEMLRSLSRRAFVREARRYVPELRAGDVVRGPSGVRAQAVDASGRLVDDFRITRQGRVVHVRNAPSPAATSSMAIAEHIVDLLS